MTLRLLFLFFFGSVALQLSAQVTCDPVFPNVDSDVTIYFHADEGNAALAGYTQAVYAHMGVITTSSQHPGDWKYVQTTWGVADPDGLMTNAGPNLWTKSFNIRTFFGIPAGETVLKLAFVFRNLNGQIVGRAADGSDIFYDVYPAGGDLLTRFVQPLGASFLTDEGVDIDVKAAASESADLRLYDNDIEISATTGLSLESTVTTSAGYHVIRFVATTATQSDTSVFSYLVADDPITEDAPSGTMGYRRNRWTNRTSCVVCPR